MTAGITNQAGADTDREKPDDKPVAQTRPAAPAAGSGKTPSPVEEEGEQIQIKPDGR